MSKRSTVWLLARSIFSVFCIISTMYGCWDDSTIAEITIMGLMGILTILTHAAYIHAVEQEESAHSRELMIRKSEAQRKVAEFELAYTRARAFDSYTTLEV